MLQHSSLQNLATYWFLVRYGVVGLTGGLLQITTLYLWVDVYNLKTQYLLGATVGFCIALAATFTLQKYWTFKDRSSRTSRQFVLYTSIALTNLGLTTLLLPLGKFVLESFGLDFFHLWYLGVQGVVIALLAALSFLANYFLTFKQPKTPSV